VIALFLANCPACRDVERDLSDYWRDRLEIFYIKPDYSRGYQRATRNGEFIGDELPVAKVPALYISDTDEVFTGYQKIMRRLQQDE